jgi:membrane protein YdbS with pleckstrin-like domain
MKARTDSQLLEHARALYKRRRWRESLDAHMQLVANGVHASDGFYGIALIRLAHGDLANARIQLLNCVRLQPSHANAHYYLGEIARLRGEHAVAIARYRRALAARPAHRASRMRLAALQPHASRAVANRGRPPMRQAAVATPGRSVAPPARSKAALPALMPLTASPAEVLLGRMRALAFSGRQRLTPFAWSLLGRWAIAFAVAWMTVIFFDSSLRGMHGPDRLPNSLMALVVCGGGLLFLWWFKERATPARWLVRVGNVVSACLALFLAGVITGALVGGMQRSAMPFILLWLCVATIWSIPLVITIRTTLCVVRDGWVRIVTGVFHRATLPIPLFKIQTITVNQSGVERLFGHADLVFQFMDEAGGAATASVRGVGRPEELQTLATEALSVGAALRAGAWRSGSNHLRGPGNSLGPTYQAAVLTTRGGPRTESRPAKSLQQRGRE